MGTQHRRRTGDRGAALIEMAIAAPLLLALVFGVIDFGVNLSNQVAVRQGVREGARQAIVAAPGAEGIDEIVELTKERVAADVPGLRVRVVASAVGEAAAGEPGSDLTVCAQAPMRSLTGFFGPILDGRVITSHVTMRVEQPLPWVDSGLTGGDDAPPDGSWSWCRAEV